MKRIAIVLALTLSAIAATTPARATDSRLHGSPSSVFPVPRDPWRSWGHQTDRPQLRHEVPRHVEPPRAHPRHVDPPRVHGRGAHGQSSVWMPAQWVWDGDNWVWWPGGWVR